MVGEKLMLSVNSHTCPGTTNGFRTLVETGYRTLRFSCGRKVTDVIRAWAVRNEQAVRLRLFPRCWTWLLRYATGTECDLIGVVRVNLKNTDRASYEQNQFNHSLEQIRAQ